MPILDRRHRNDPRRQATERALLEAPLSQLEEGVAFADLNVSRITERAGRTRPAFYTHFEDRRALLLALLKQAGAESLVALAPFIAVDGPAGRDEVMASSTALLAAFRVNATLVRTVIEAAGYDDVIAAYWAEIVGRVIDGSARRFQAEGLSVDDAHATATALVWMTERVCYQQGRVALEGTKHRPSSFLDIIDAHLATAKPHPAGTTDRLGQASCSQSRCGDVMDGWTSSRTQSVCSAPWNSPIFGQPQLN